MAALESRATPCLMVVVAHPDDETFGCGSVLLHAAARGARTVVVCATRGEAGEVAGGVSVPPGGVAALREGELRAAAEVLGVHEVEVLDFVDSNMEGAPERGTLCGAPLDSVVAAVRDACERHRPDVVVALDGSDGHRDHMRIRAATLTVLEGQGVPLYLQGFTRSLAEEWVRHKIGVAAARAYVENPTIGTPDDEITTLLDGAAYYDVRQAAMAMHRSQASPYDGLPEDLRRQFLTVDQLVRVFPPWPGGEHETDLLGLPPG